MHIKTVMNLIRRTMKRILLIIAFTVVLSSLYAQKSIDALFGKYAGKQGFVTITIDGNLLELFKSGNDGDKDDALPAKVTSIRMLVQDDDDIVVDNFYDQVMKGIDLDQYEEFMSVKESDQDLRMLVKANGRKIKEFLLVGGGKDNLLIQVKGDITFDEARKFSKDAKKNHGINIVADSR